MPILLMPCLQCCSLAGDLGLCPFTRPPAAKQLLSTVHMVFECWRLFRVYLKVQCVFIMQCMCDFNEDSVSCELCEC